MLHITILAVGRLKEGFWAAGAAEYLKRLPPYARVKVVEVNDEGFSDKSTPAMLEKVVEKEGDRLLKRLQPGTCLVALDQKGVMRSSEEMAGLLDNLALEGKSDITFAIGGSLGLSQRVLERSDFRLSFSRMTFPHQLVRVILLEQVFRWFKIARGEPYHK